MDNEIVERAELLEALERWLERIREVNRQVPVLVEGRNDIRALRKLGLPGSVFHLHKGGVSIYERCKWISARYPQVILLLDADPRGHRLRRMVIRFLESDWETYDDLRAELFQIVGHFVRHIEELARFYEKMYIVVHYRPMGAEKTGH